MSIIVNSLSYIHPDRTPLFSNIHFSVSKGRKAALIGDNGTGKSTLLRILAGLLSPSEGEVVLSGKSYYVPQHTGQYDNCTIAEALGVGKKREALQAILGGDASFDHFNVLGDDWQIEERLKTALSFWGIGHLQPGEFMKHLSGGEKTKVFLAGIQIHAPQTILLDEPSNHLDSKSRAILYDWIKNSKSTVLCVSHDRTLLNLPDTTFELFPDSVEMFGGNYDFYKQARGLQLEALHRQRAEKEKTLRQTLEKSREVAERRRKQEARGEAATQKKSLPRIVANNLQSKAQQSSARVKETQDEKIRDLSENLREIKGRIRQQTVLRTDFKASGLHKGKVLADAKNIRFSYGERELWKKPLSFLIRSGERISIEGENGSGKTTLVKILTGDLAPSSGEIFTAGFDYLHMDQEYSAIDGNLSLFGQAERFNERNLPEHELKMLLHTHRFPKETWDKKCAALSGGEKMRLILCCVSVRNNTPDVIILDEPTNNLDVHSQEILTGVVRDFGGTVLLISHDRYFKKEVGIDRIITLGQ